MRVATYNIWNNNVLFEERIEEICKAIKEVNADVVCLQEVRNEEDRSIAKIIANEVNYPFFVFRYYPDSPDEGLAILSRHPIIHAAAIWETNTEISNYCAVRARLKHEGTFIGVINVHLNWRSEFIRKEQLIAVNNWIEMVKDCEKYEIICGDFNDVPQSIIHEFLKGCGWKDVVELNSKEDTSKYATFDLIDNPHLKEDQRAKERLRYDWIMINCLNKNEELNLEAMGIFGNNPLAYKVMPSDHYGFYIDIK